MWLRMESFINKFQISNNAAIYPLKTLLSCDARDEILGTLIVTLIDVTPRASLHYSSFSRMYIIKASRLFNSL